MAEQADPAHSVVDAIQSLIVAFVLAMTFRGFVTEGFVIPTGSMAPTLLGQHVRLKSDQTGWVFPVGVDQGREKVEVDGVVDPMLGRHYPGSGATKSIARSRMGDRILVLKSLFPFSRPSRFDVVVFKNPTNPNGEDGNYIKRLIGLPGEAIFLTDGDVFAAPGGRSDDFSTNGPFKIQRKPEHVQRAVWQPIYHSDYIPIRPMALTGMYAGSPWGGDRWLTEERRSYRTDTAAATTLQWNNHLMPLTDWAPYNQLTPMSRSEEYYVSDLRVAASIVPDQPGLETVFLLTVRDHQFQFILRDDEAVLRMRSSDWDTVGPSDGWQSVAMPVKGKIDPLPPGEPTSVEFWHVDQQMILFIDGNRIAELAYEWGPLERLQHMTNSRFGDDVTEMIRSGPGGPAEIEWAFEGSPVTLHRVQLDRDLYYRPDRIGDRMRNPTPRRFEGIVHRGQFAFGTHPDNLAILGPDHFFMLGDNSSASSDSRLWGAPHPLVAAQVDPAPFVVHRSLLLGKAWVVYFPSPLPINEGGRGLIPDFGRLRFIR